ncbi:glycosyltransferase family 2 protein [Evansella sp. AB-P1]|uniref:glycosyltransferase family 2 protein n=1 Tax=Evansella sp. AB-P1 TaxID=3037653 RepID=UPI00241EBB2F|nr:glycosyltransferase family 2 protein [Evansella sp. AB-P1]MDG5788676.1 glycosyltransferase family 2 protein [Evansella sp. AB-P1]
MKADIIIPAFNEAERIETTLNSLKNEKWVEKIIVVDDGSEDNTKIIAKRHCDELVIHDRNRGKSAAIYTGLSYVESDFILLLDSDLGETVTEGRKLLSPVISKKADMTVAIFPHFSKRGFGFVKRRGQRVIYRETGYRITSPLSGQRCFHRSWIPYILSKTGYGFGLEMSLNLLFLKNGGVIKEVATSMNHRLTGKDFSGMYHRFKQWREMEKTIWNY